GREAAQCGSTPRAAAQARRELMRREKIVSWLCDSGNQCTVTIVEDVAREIRLSFDWARDPSADDREEWTAKILSAAAHELLDYAFQERACVEVLRQMEADGKLRRAGVNAQGDWM